MENWQTVFLGLTQLGVGSPNRPIFRQPNSSPGDDDVHVSQNR